MNRVEIAIGGGVGKVIDDDNVMESLPMDYIGRLCFGLLLGG